MRRLSVYTIVMLISLLGSFLMAGTSAVDSNLSSRRMENVIHAESDDSRAHGGKMTIQSETEIIMGTTDSVESCLDPARAYDFFGWQIIQSLGCGLVEHKVNASGSQERFTQSLATSWNVSDDDLAWTFNLRQGIRYDDETEFNATHVKYTFDRGIGIADPDGAWIGIGYGDIIKNVTVVDTYTVRFYLNSPFGLFLSLIACPAAFIVDPANAPIDQVVNYFEDNPRASNPMGLGPYTLKNWTRIAGKDTEIDLVANPNYWDASAGFPKTKNIIIKMFSDATQLALAISSKQVDIAFRQLAATDINSMKNDATLHVWEGTGAFIQYLVLQEKYAPFNVTAIRQAVGAAVNRTALVQTVFLGQAQNLYSLIPIGMFGHTDAFLSLGDPNYTLTRELLAPLGYNESNKLTFKLWYETSGHYSQSAQQATVLAASLEASGVITVTIDGLDWPAYRVAWQNEAMEAFIMGWYPDYIDPDDYVYPLVQSQGASWLHCNYNNTNVDELIELGRERLTVVERAAVYTQIQGFVADDCPIVPLYQGLTQAVSVVGIEGIYLDISQLLRLWYITKEEATKRWIVDDDGPADFSTIQEAIDAASVGDTVFVRNGTYYENVVVNKTVSVIGEDNWTTIIDGGKNGVVVSLEANNSNISGFTIQNSGSSDYDCGASVHSSANNLSNNIVRNNNNGILINPDSNDNIMTDNSVSESELYGIHLWRSNNSILNGNIVTNGLDGIIIEFCSNTTLRNNTISDNVWNFGVGGEDLPYFIQDIDTSNKVEGKPIQYLINKENIVIDSTWDIGYLCLVNSTNVTVKDLALNTPSWHGIQFAYTKNSRIENVTISETSYAIDFVYSFNNSVVNSKISNRNGIMLWKSNDNIIIGNNISRNDFAVLLFYSSNNTIMNNNINNNWRGIFLYSSNNRMYHNNFIDNGVQIFTEENAYVNIWDNGCEGNYWSDYNGTDFYHGPSQNETGSDGIGDSAYEIDSANKDNYPLMKPYPFGEHDIGITYIGRVYSFDLLVPLKTVVGLRFSLNISAFVMNYGNQTETCSVQVYVNDTLVGTFANVTLESRQSVILNLRWNTTGFAYGNYTVIAVADNLAGETDVSDNAYADGIVYVGIPGDVNGDGKVDMKDIGYVAVRFCRNPKDSNWSSNADLNDDGKIDMYDIGFAARHFMDHL
jgi:peptide/nickel transport system substrate-binding protein